METEDKREKKTETWVLGFNEQPAGGKREIKSKSVRAIESAFVEG